MHKLLTYTRLLSQSTPDSAQNKKSNSIALKVQFMLESNCDFSLISTIQQITQSRYAHILIKLYKSNRLKVLKST